MKKILCLVLAAVLNIASPASYAATSDPAGDKDILTFVSDPAAFTGWLEKHEASTHSDTLVRIIKAVEQSKLSETEMMQAVAVSVARVIRASGSAATQNLVRVANEVNVRWLPVMVAAATLVRGVHGLATQKALISCCTGKDGLDLKVHAAATAPGQVLGAAIAVRTVRSSDVERSMPMPPVWAASVAAVPVIAAHPPAIPVIVAADLRSP